MNDTIWQFDFEDENFFERSPEKTEQILQKIEKLEKETFNLLNK